MKRSTIKLMGITAVLAAISIIMTGCGQAYAEQVAQSLEYLAEYAVEPETQTAPEEDAAAEEAAAADEKPSENAPVAAENDICIIFTSDVHCGIDQGFGYAGLEQIRTTLEKKGYATILVDNGDAVQGEAIGTVTDGEAIIPLMNALKYDAAIPGNHEFDYGMDEFFRLVDMADFPYISCNFTKEGKLVFSPYIIKEIAGRRIAFVGVTTPETLSDESPSLFRDESGKYIYGFTQGNGDGAELFAAVQKAVDDARAEGADYVYILGHIGNIESSSPYTSMDIIENTNGIDVFLDGHSHDVDQMTVKNMDGEDVVRSACGTKLNAIGYSIIKAEDGSIDTGIWTFSGKDSIPSLFDIENSISALIDKENADFEEKLGEVVARTDVDLTINDPIARDEDGLPIRIVRSKETNLGDLCADAARISTGADIGIVNGGGVRANIKRGDVTYKDIIDVHPFGNKTVVIKATGQQIMDALEWSCRSLPAEDGGFLQVSNLTFTVDLSTESTCTEDPIGQMTGVGANRRVSQIKVGGEAIDPGKEYTVAGNSFILTENGNGYTVFDGDEVVAENAGLDNQLLIEYINNTLGGVIGEEYSLPYGEGRIVINE